MRFGIFTIKRDEVVNSLIDILKNRNIDYHVINPKNIITDFNSVHHYKLSLYDLDVIFVRDLGFESFFRFDILKILEEYTTVINSYNSINISSNKFLSSLTFKKNNLPIPKTYVTENLAEALKIIDYLNVAVIKPIFGCRGEGIIKIKKEYSITKKYKLLEEFQKKYITFYIQEFIKPKDNIYKDIRAFVIDDEIFPIYRIGGTNWKNNISLGANIEECPLNEEIRELSLKAKDALGLFYGGIDIIEGDEGYFLLEGNATPSWLGVSKIYPKIPEILVDKIINEVKK